MAVEKFGVARATGYDIDPERIKEANENAKKAGVSDKTRFVLGNLFEADFRDADIVTLYLLPAVNLKLRPKLLKDLKVGSRIRVPSIRHGRMAARPEDLGRRAHGLHVDGY